MSRQGKELFEKGLEAFKKRDFEEAFKILSECSSIEHDDLTEIYLKRCKKELNSKNDEIEQNLLIKDNECRDILDKNNYYEIFGMEKNSKDEEIKKSYKKVKKYF